MAKRLSEHATIEQARRFRDPDGGGAVDMRIDVEFAGEIVLSVGGRWDRQIEEYDGDAASRVVVEPHIGQIKSIEWFREWLCVHAERRSNPPEFSVDAVDKMIDQTCHPSEVFSAMFAGGRRGGKTWIGALMCALYAVQFPDAIVWVVNPSDKKHEEVRRYMHALLAPEWIARETIAEGWELINGSVIHLKSGHTGADPDAIKEGNADVIWLNEGQKMKERVYVVARGAAVDHSGLVLVCANPPVEANDQQWVTEFAAEAQDGRRMSMYIHFNPLDNPHINRIALLSLKQEIDVRAFRIEVLGEFLPPADCVAYNWIRTREGNERSAPVVGDRDAYPTGVPHHRWLDVTAEFLEQIEEGVGITDIVGMDFQVLPHMGGPLLRIYAPIDQAPTRKNVIVWGVGEVVIQGDEVEWCAAAVEFGLNPETTLIVGDGTGQYQHSRRRSVDSPPPTWKGRGSFDLIKGEGFRNIIPPSRRIRNNNPHVVDRVRSMTSMIEVDDRRRLFLDPIRCPKTCASIRGWKNVHGKPSRIQAEAHLGDSLSYPLVRLFPRIFRSETNGKVDPVKNIIERESMTASDVRQRAPRRARRGGGL